MAASAGIARLARIGGKEATMSAIPTHVETAVHLTPDELVLVIAALRLLRSTLGRDEAEELHEVQALLERLERLAG
jgi:hypothetical protein